MISFSLAVEDPGLLTEVQSALRDEPVRCMFEQSSVSDMSLFVENLIQAHPDVAFVDVGSLRDTVTEVMSKVRLAAPRTFIIALNTKAESTTLLDCFHAGANEYLVPPVHDGIRNALHNRLKQTTGYESRHGKTVGFLAAKGGCGASTLVCHVATELGRLRRKVLLADFDVESGLVGFLTGVKSSYSVADAFRNTTRLDNSYWGALVSRREPGLDVITAPTSTDAKRVPEAEQVQRVLEYSRKNYEWTVLDLGHGLTPFILTTLGFCDELCLVVEPNIPALHQAKGIVQTLLDSGFGRDRIRLVLNRIPRRMDFDPAELQKVLGLPLFAAIKCQETDLREALTERDLLPAKSELARQANRLARKLSNEPEEPKKRFSFFR